jgi:hypothetical protein
MANQVAVHLEAAHQVAVEEVSPVAAVHLVGMLEAE